MPTVDELIKDLVNFRTRSVAKSALLELGDEVIEPLIKAMDSGYASVRWSAVTILGELRAKQALPHMVTALKDPDVRTAAADALKNLTGENFGEDYDAWQRWLALGADTAAAGESSATSGGASAAELVKQAVHGTDISAEKTERGYTLRVTLADRHQDVHVSSSAKDSDGAALLVVHTRCGPANAKHYEWALRQNVKMSAGAIAIADVAGKPAFVIVDVLVLDEATPGMLIEAVRRLARKGDQLESALTKADQF
jgi:HEAT repeat protein